MYEIDNEKGFVIEVAAHMHDVEDLDVAMGIAVKVLDEVEADGISKDRLGKIATIITLIALVYVVAHFLLSFTTVWLVMAILFSAHIFLQGVDIRRDKNIDKVLIGVGIHSPKEWEIIKKAGR